MAMKKAIILARVSTAGQADEELPIAGQIEACRAKAEELGATVVKAFTEEGVSGRKERRDVFDEAVDYCGIAEIDYFILWNTARFSRSSAVAAWAKHNLRRGGTEMIYVSQNINTGTDEGWLLEKMFEMMDEQYSRTVSNDTRRTLLKNARDGFFNGGRVPFGYASMPEGKRRRLAIVESEACLVREIFRDCLAGVGAKNSAQRLNQAGLLRRGQRWTKNTMLNLLANWTCCGYTTFNRTNHATRTDRPEDEWVRTRSHPAIISEEDFMSVQKLVSARAPAAGVGHVLSTRLFTGMLQCGACDKGLVIQTGKGRGGKLYSYYNCGSSHRGSGCVSRMIPTDKLDRWLMDAVTKHVLNRERIADFARQIHELSGDWIRQRSERRKALVAELRDAERRRRNVYAILEEHGRGAPNLADLGAGLRELNSQVKTLEASLTELEARPAPTAAIDEVTLDQVEGFVKGIVEGGDPRRLREFLRTFIERVVLEDRGATIHYDPARLVDARPLQLVRSSSKWLPNLGSLRTVRIEVELPESYWRRAA